MKPKVLVPIVIGVITVIAIAYFLFLRGDSEFDKVVKSLNAQNYEMAVAKLKEALYDDEEDLDSKALLLYAQTRKTFDENNIKTFRKSLRASLPNFIYMKNFIYQNKLNEEGYLTTKEKEQFLSLSKDYRQQLAKIGVVTEDVGELETLLKRLCEIGVANFKLSQGDEVDQAFYAFLLAGNSFFGNKESGTNLLKLAKLNEEAIPLFVLCGENFTEDLKKELENDQTLFGDIAKHLVIRKLVQNEVKNLFDNYPKMQSAIDYLSDTNKILSRYFYITYKNNSIFFDDNIFSEYFEILKQNSKAGIDVSVNLSDGNNIVCIYFYDSASKQFISKFYNFLQNELLPISFKDKGSTKTKFTNEESPIRFSSFDKKTNELIIATDRSIKKTGFRNEQRYNPKKYYSPYSGYSGGYEYVSVPYEYDDISSSTKTFNLNKNNAEFISEYDPNNEIKYED